MHSFTDPLLTSAHLYYSMHNFNKIKTHKRLNNTFNNQWCTGTMSVFWLLDKPLHKTARYNLLRLKMDSDHQI